MRTPPGVYFDSALIVKFYLQESGSDAVRALAQRAGPVCSSALAIAEVSAAFHRNLREGGIARKTFDGAVGQFSLDVANNVWNFSPITIKILDDIRNLFTKADAKIFLRAGDAIHLVTALNLGFESIYTNDRHLLAACVGMSINGIKPV